MSRLNSQNLPTLSGEVIKPAYDRVKVSPGIVHLGIGAFHRAPSYTLKNLQLPLFGKKHRLAGRLPIAF